MSAKRGAASCGPDPFRAPHAARNPWTRFSRWSHEGAIIEDALSSSPRTRSCADLASLSLLTRGRWSWVRCLATKSGRRCSQKTDRRKTGGVAATEARAPSANQTRKYLWLARDRMRIGPAASTGEGIATGLACLSSAGHAGPVRSGRPCVHSWVNPESVHFTSSRLEMAWSEPHEGSHRSPRRAHAGTRRNPPARRLTERPLALVERGATKHTSETTEVTTMQHFFNQLLQFLQQSISAIFRFAQLIWTWSVGQISGLVQVPWQDWPLWKQILLALVIGGVGWALYRAAKDLWEASERISGAFATLLGVLVRTLPRVMVAGLIALSGVWVLNNLDLSRLQLLPTFLQTSADDR